MNRTQLEPIIRAASAITDSQAIVVLGSQAIHAQHQRVPKEALLSMEADVYPKDCPERADLIEGSIGEHSYFHDTFGYYAQGVSPSTAILPTGWQDRLQIIHNENTGTGIGLCLELHDLVLSKFVANREKDDVFNRAVIEFKLVDQQTLLQRLPTMPLDESHRQVIATKINQCFQSHPA